MTSNDREGLGAMTGATGSLSPDDIDEEFVPAEQREISDPTGARQGTASRHARAGQREAEPTEAGSLMDEDQIAEMPEPPLGKPAQSRSRPRIGGDERHDTGERY
jgi:hypothetical protein